MKKRNLILLSLLSLTMLSGCKRNSGSTSQPSINSPSHNSASTAPSTKPSDTAFGSASSGSTTPSVNPSTPSVPVVKKAVVKKVYNFAVGGTLNVNDGDEIDAGDVTLTLTFATAAQDSYDIGINSTVGSMVRSNDGLSYTYTFHAEEGKSYTIIISKKQNESKSGQIITFTPEHYTIVGIESGKRYHPYLDQETYEQYTIDFALIPEDGYYIDSVRLQHPNGGANDAPRKLKDGYYSIDDLFDEDCTLVVDVSKIENHSITYIGATEENHIDVKNSTLPSSFEGGSKVDFAFKAKEGYTITSVSFDPKVEGIRDYSSFSVDLPNQDVRITITTSSIIQLRTLENEHVKNVKFYSELDYGDTDDTSYGLPKNEITTLIPTGNNEFFAVFDLDEGYKCASITDSSKEEDGKVYGYDEEVRTKEGKYVFRTTMKEDCVMQFNLLSGKHITLDATQDSSKIELAFEDDQKFFYEEDRVKFAIGLNFTGETYKIKEVTYSYNPEGGETVTDTVTKAPYGSFPYSFTMPGYDVTLHVELVKVETVSLQVVNEATGLVKSFFLNGKVSKTRLDNTTLSSSAFEKNEGISININPTDDHSKTIKAVFADSEGNENEIPLTADINAGQYICSDFILSSGGTVYFREGEKKQARTVTYTSTSSFTFFDSSKKEVTSLTEVYDMDVFYFSVNDTVEEGKMLALSLTIGGTKAELSEFEIDGKTAYKVLVSGDVRIDVSQYEAVLFTVEDDSGYFDHRGFYDADTGEEISVDSGKIKKNTRFYYGGDDFFFISSITIGGSEAAFVEDELLGVKVYTATADVVIHINCDF